MTPSDKEMPDHYHLTHEIVHGNCVTCYATEQRIGDLNIHNLQLEARVKELKNDLNDCKKGFREISRKNSERAIEIQNTEKDFYRVCKENNQLRTKLEAAEKMAEAVNGLLYGVDLVNGTHAKIYRPKLENALELWRKVNE